MEQFCKTLHPELEFSPTCSNWFQQAAEHCTILMQRTSIIPGKHFWTTVNNYIFPDRNNGLLTQKIPISIHPNRLSILDCHALFFNIVNDYIFRAPHYSAEYAVNILLRQIIFSLLGVMALAPVLLSLIFAYHKYVKSLAIPQQDNSWFSLDNRISAQLRRNLRMVKFELQHLHVRHIVQPEELFVADDTETLVLKMSTKFNFIDGIVTNNIQTIGHFYRKCDKHSRNKRSEFKALKFTKVLRSLNNNLRKLRVLFIFDEDPIYDALMRRQSIDIQPRTNSPKRSQIVGAKSTSNIRNTAHGLSLSPRSLSPILKPKPSSSQTTTTIPAYQSKHFTRPNLTFSLRTNYRDIYSDRFGKKQTDKFQRDLGIKRKKQ